MYRFYTSQVFSSDFWTINSSSALWLGPRWVFFRLDRLWFRESLGILGGDCSRDEVKGDSRESQGHGNPRLMGSGPHTSFPYGGFLKLWYPQNTPKWSFYISRKTPWLLGTTILGNHHIFRDSNMGVVYRNSWVVRGPMSLGGPWKSRWWSYNGSGYLSIIWIYPPPQDSSGFEIKL